MRSLPQIFVYKKEHLLTQAERKSLIATLVDSGPEKIVLENTKYGRPFLKSPRIKNFDFNLSHSGNYTVIAVAGCQVGVDIEKLRPLDIKIAVACFTKRELKYLNSCPEKRLERFYEMWVLKESFIKAIGRGLSFPFKKINFRYNGGKNMVLKLRNRKKRWFFRIYDIDKDYKMAVCLEKNKFPRKINFNRKI